MVYYEIKERNGNKYYYRAASFRDGDKVSKKRIYLGKNLTQNKLILKEKEADKEIYSLKRERRGEEFEVIKEKLIKILKEKGVKKAGIFGSYARGEQKKKSDIDILIEPNKNISGFNFISFQEDVAKKLGKRVDIITYKGINHLLKDRILSQEVRII